MKLLHKKAIVTGANRSIGRAIAIEFARHGADVLISYRSDKPGALDTVAAIEAQGRKAWAVHADFSATQGITSFFDTALETLGAIHVLVNNAGGYNTQPFLDLDVHEFEALIKVGVTAPMVLSQLTAKHMLAHHIAGSIINISSVSGTHPHPNRVAHATAKAGLNMLTRNMALELAPHKIRVNAILPGGTPYATDPGAAELVKYDPNTPLQRSGKPEDQAKMALFLASSDADWLTGQLITVDGGQTLV